MILGAGSFELRPAERSRLRSFEPLRVSQDDNSFFFRSAYALLIRSAYAPLFAAYVLLFAAYAVLFRFVYGTLCAAYALLFVALRFHTQLSGDRLRAL